MTLVVALWSSVGRSWLPTVVVATEARRVPQGAFEGHTVQVFPNGTGNHPAALDVGHDGYRA